MTLTPDFRTLPQDPALLQSQYPPSAPVPTGLTIDTNTIAPDQQAADRMRHCDENAYSLEPESHFMRFAKVLLGAAGAGQLRSKLLVARLGQNLNGMHFFDLDRFYGSIFGFKRTSDESYTGVNPYTDVLTSDQWMQLQAQDASYRSRIIQFGQAVALCPTPQGLTQAAEAIIASDCDLYEVYSLLDANQGTYTGVVTDGSLYGRAGNSRSEFVIRPKRGITEEERYALVRTLTQLKPAGALLTVDPNGVRTETAVSLRGVAADSNYWEVTKTVTPQAEIMHLYPFDYTVPGPWELPRPPFRYYQGEAWSYVADVALWNAYAYDVNGLLLTPYNWDRVVWRDGNTFEYVPAFGLIDVRDIFYGRSVSDGILVSSPYPGFYAGINSALTSLYCDRLPVGPLVDYMRGQFQESLIPTGNRFWATPSRAMEDQTQEVYETSFVGERLLNHISFSIAHYPHQATVYYQNSTMDSGTWSPLLNFNGDPVTFTVNDSSPNRFGMLPMDYVGHPQHYGDDHWVKCSAGVDPVSVKAVRVVLQRIPGGPPLQPRADIAGINGWGPAPYSLAVYNFDCGYRVIRREDLPIRRNWGFSTAIDIVGSRLQISAKEHLAKDLISGAGPWKSDMLPTKNSVVNFFVDTRDSSGNGQLIDRFYLDPLYPGPNINLYYSNDDPSTGFNSDDESVPQTYATVTGTPVPVEGQWLDLDTHTAKVVFDNRPFQFDPTQSWWHGFEFLPQYYSNDGVSRALWDFGGHTLTFVGGRAYFTNPNNEQVYVTLPNWGPNQPIKVIFGYTVGQTDMTDGVSEQTMFLHIQRGSDPMVYASVPVRVPITAPASYLIMGGHHSYTFPSNMYLTAAMLKMEPLSWAGVNAFFADPHALVVKPMFSTEIDYTTNALWRFHHTLIDTTATTDTTQWGVVGGPGEFWTSLTWQPLPRDYQMQKGMLKIPPTMAKFFKFEISNLVPEQYEVFVQTERTVSTTHYETLYIPGRTTFSVVTQVANTFGSPVYSVVGVTSNMMMATTLWYYDGFRVQGIAPAYVQRLSPTAAYTVLSPNALTGQRYRVSIVIGRTLPITVGRTYTTTQTIDEVKAVTKTGFVCGLKAISAYRLDFSATDDSTDYIEHFDDSLHISSMTGLTQVNNSLMSTYGSEATFGEAVSTTFGSSRPVQAVQFASMQTDPTQLLTDPHFVDTLTNNWVLVGDATGTATVDHGADIVRTGVPRTYGSEGPTYNAMQSSTYGSLEVQSGTTVGGLASEPTTVSSSGRIVASTTVSTTSTLSSPLHFQLLAQDGTLLAEEVASLSAGETLTMQLSYTAGSTLIPLAYSAIEGTSYGTLNSTTYGSHESRPITGPITLQVVQTGVSSDAWTIHDMNLWDDAISWEFSVDNGATWYRAVDIRNNANGILTFPAPGKQLRYRVRFYRDNLAVSGLHIKPWYVSSDLAMLPRMPIVPAGPNLTPPPAKCEQWPMFLPQRAGIVPLNHPPVAGATASDTYASSGVVQPFNPRPAPGSVPFAPDYATVVHNTVTTNQTRAGLVRSGG